MGEEISYRLAQIKYYLLVAWDKFRELNWILQGLITIALIFLSMFIFGVGPFAKEQSQTQTSSSSEAKTVTIPDLTTKPKQEAIETLQSLGVESIESSDLKEYSGTTGDEIVIKQVPSGGAAIPSTTPVKLMFGSKTIYEKSKVEKAIPKVKNQSLIAVEESLRKDGFTNVTFNLPESEDKKKYIVTGVSPLEGSKVPLTTKISLTVQKGIDAKSLVSQMREKYTNYDRRIAKIEVVEGRTVHIYIAKNDPKIKSQASADEAARVYKVTLEQTLGEPFDRVLLTVPGAKYVGDSTQAIRSITTNGLSIQAARQACEERAQQDLGTVEFNWSRGTVENRVLADRIKLGVWSSIQNDNYVKSSVVVRCEVSGTNDNPQVTSFRAD